MRAALSLIALPALFALAACAGASEGSIGAVLARDPGRGTLVVREAPLGLPAARAGLVEGDELLMIDGVYARDLDPAALRARLRGKVGTPVRLTVVRGQEVYDLVLVRAPLRE